MAVAALHHRISGLIEGEPVLLGGSLGSSLTLWEELVPALGDYQVVAFEHRGHGESPTTAAPLTVTDLVDDVLALADRLRFERFHYLGISLGGAIGQQLALDHPDRLSSLILACTAPRFGDPGTWADRAAAVREHGLAPLREPTGERWFAPDVRRDRPERVRQILDGLVATDPESYAACCEALAGFDTTSQLPEVRVPTTVISAESDQVAPPADIERLLAIPGAQHHRIAGSAHLANVGRPEEFNGAVRAALRAHQP